VIKKEKFGNSQIRDEKKKFDNSPIRDENRKKNSEILQFVIKKKG